MDFKLTFRLHALQRMYVREISVGDVRSIVNTGEVIKEYPDDKPYPSRLILGWHDKRPVHIVVADNTDNLDETEVIVIMVYEPDPQIWEDDFKRKKK
jgi:hypothetical protein